jgi:hypothetical protein
MTAAEYRIIEFLMTSNATRPADLPDWLLALIEGDDGGAPSHELITTASLMYVRRERPGISFGAAREVIAGYAADPAKLEELTGRVTAFRLSCCLERLKRSGRFEDVLVDDPFDPEGGVSVVLTEGEWRALNAGPPRPGMPRGPHDPSLN